jgi:acyl carrier protein
MNQRLARILAEVFAIRPSEVHRGLRRADVGNWDSLKQMDLVVSLESEYEISLEIPDILRMVSVAAIEEILQAKGIDLAD